MTIRKAYANLTFSGRMHLILIRYLIITTAISFFLSERILGQEDPEYYEISVFLEVPRIGGIEIDAVIKDQEIYLPVTNLFDFLKIRNIPSPDFESISGFFINPEATYLFSRTENKIIYQDKTFNIEPGDLIRTESNLYLKSKYYGNVFGLECVFNFRSLSVKLNSKLELPFIREMRQIEMRRNLNRLNGEVIADTIIDRSYPVFKFGMADWSAIASEDFNGKTETRLNLNLGSMIAGGEATASINYKSEDPFTEKQQYYLWRYVNNNFKPLRQVLAGKIATNAISSIYNPVIGIQFTNTPSKYRRSFGTYTLSDKTEPGWIVELYVNNVLVDYVKADASGFFTFQVPLVYGNSIVVLKFFGPWGEERSKEQNINIPFNFLPEKTMEYTISAGIVEDSIGSKFSKANVNYGINRSLTVGAGIEYLSSVLSGPVLPYVNASLRITNNLLFSGQYTYGVRASGTLSYRMPSNIQFVLNYKWYEKEQKAINFNYREERKAVISIPLQIGKFYSYQRLSVYQIVLPSSKYTTGEWMFSGSVLGINTNLTSYALFIGNNKPYLYSNLSLAFKLPASFILRSQFQYGYTQNELISTKIGLEKHLFEHAYMNFSFEQNYRSNMRMAELGLRYDFSFAQTGFSTRQSENRTTLIQYARGSLINDRKTKYLGTDNRTNVGKGGISIMPFLDLNGNGRKDEGEPKAYGLNLHTNGGRIEKNSNDTIIRILGLEPYTSCFIELDPNSFDNIAWRLPKQTLSVSVDPNILKLIEIPVIVAGEATGMVTLEKEGITNGIGRIILEFFNSSSKSVGKTLTEEDGYFSYFGLSPGSYFVMPDTSQMNKLRMISDPGSLQFNITSGIDGDIIDGLDFALRKIPEDSTYIPLDVAVEKKVSRMDTTYMIIHEVTQELITITEDSYAIQLGAFKRRSNAENQQIKLEKLLGKRVEIVIENNFYKVRIIDLKDRNEVDQNLTILRLNGITEVWVISLKAKQQQLVLKEIQDTIITIKETVTESAIPFSITEISVQVGAFRQESNALELRNKLSSTLKNNVVIVPENGYYKVRIKGFASQEELEKLLPSLGLIGMRDIWILPGKIEEEKVPEVKQPEPEKPDTTINPVEVMTDVPVIEEKSVAPEPNVSLQVGVFYKRSQALRAQRKITSKLNLPVKIVQQWDAYRVIVTGFYTREETYKYYPELAGLGYPKISLIEE